MGLNIKMYEVEEEKFLDSNTKKETTQIMPYCNAFEVFHKNYIFMDWLNKYMGFELDPCELICYPAMIEAFLNDYEIAARAFNSYLDRNNKVTPEGEKIIEEYFPRNWNKYDRTPGDTKKLHVFDHYDYSDLLDVRRAFEGFLNSGKFYHNKEKKFILSIGY